MSYYACRNIEVSLSVLYACQTVMTLSPGHRSASLSFCITLDALHVIINCCVRQTAGVFVPVAHLGIVVDSVLCGDLLSERSHLRRLI